MKTRPLNSDIQLLVDVLQTGTLIEVPDGGGMHSHVRGVATTTYQWGDYTYKGSVARFVDNGDGSATILRAIDPSRLVFVPQTMAPGGPLAPYEVWGEILPINGTDMKAVRKAAREKLVSKMLAAGFTSADLELLASK